MVQKTLENKESCDETRKQLDICLLSVEELNQPGRLLIELKSLEASILKGVLEHRSDKLWARFVIEASDGFNWMMILCSLMHLLHMKR